MKKINPITKKLEMLYLDDHIKELYDHPKLKNLFLEVTSRCNARCEHCGSSCGNKVVTDEIEAEYLKKALKEIADKYKASDILLNVTGGEPLLRKDLFELMEYATNLGFGWGITTNGMLIDKKMAEKLEKYKLDTISISIDGLKETHESFRKVPNSFEKIINAIKLLQKNKYLQCLQITTVANKKNFHELEDLYKLMQDLKIKDWRVISCDPIGRAEKNDSVLLDNNQMKQLLDFIIEKNSEGKMKVTYGCAHYLGSQYEMETRPYYFMCSTGLTVASILSNGDIYACPNVERRKELIQGNIRKDSFVDVWENKFEQFRHKRITTNSKCQKCPDYKFCRGDSFHTWDFENNEPKFCIKNVLKGDETNGIR